MAPWVPHTHGASLCRRRAAPVAHRPTWLPASSPVEAPVRGVLELWFEERVPRSDPGPHGHRGILEIADEAAALARERDLLRERRSALRAELADASAG